MKFGWVPKYPWGAGVCAQAREAAEALAQSELQPTVAFLGAALGPVLSQTVFLENPCFLRRLQHFTCSAPPPGGEGMRSILLYIVLNFR